MRSQSEFPEEREAKYTNARPFYTVKSVLDVDHGLEAKTPEMRLIVKLQMDACWSQSATQLPIYHLPAVSFVRGGETASNPSVQLVDALSIACLFVSTTSSH